MPPRVQVSNVPATATIHPAANPVVRYVQPQAPTQTVGESGAVQLARVLQSVNPALTQFAANEESRDDAAAVQAAKNERARTNIRLSKAVSEGVIDPHQHPLFVRTWRYLDGQALADDFNRDLLTALAQGPLANSTNPLESDKLIGEFRANWFQQNVAEDQRDSDFLNGWTVKSNAHLTNARVHQSQNIGKNITAAAGDAFEANVFGVLEELDSRDLSFDAAAEGIALNRQRLMTLGVSPQELNQKIVDLVVEDAVERGSADTLRVLDKVSTGPGFLGGTAYARNARMNAEIRIAQVQGQRDAASAKLAKDERDRVVGNAYGAIASMLVQDQIDGKATTLEEAKVFMDALIAKGEGDMALQLQDRILKTQKEAEPKENDFVLNKIYTDTFGNGSTDVKELTRYFSNGQINRKTYDDQVKERRTNLDRAQKADADADGKKLSVKSVLSDPAFKQAYDTMSRTIGGSDFTDWNASAKLNEGRSQAEFTKTAFNWLKQNPEATDIDKLEFAAKLRDTYIKLFAPDIDITKGPVVNPVGAERPQGSSNIGDLRRSEGQLVAPAKAPQPWQNTRYFATTADFETALKERAEAPGNSRLDKLATQLGVSVQDLIMAQNGLYK